MYGYDFWDEMVAAGRSGVTVPYDRDLPEDKRHRRLLAVARRLARTEGFCLVEAIDLVHRVSPTTDDILHDKSLTYSRIYDEALVEEKSVYWAGRMGSTHPLVPPGFDLKEAHSEAAGAEYRLNLHLSGPRVPSPSLWILCPEPPWCSVGFGHIHFRRGDYLEVEPMPSAYLLCGCSGQNARQRREGLQMFFQTQYPKLRVAERDAMLERWLAALRTLSKAAAMPRSKRQGLQFTISLRARLKLPWYWPFESLNPDPALLEKSRSHAEKEDADIQRYFGRDPGYFYSR